jgi:hypothetical protein
MATPFENSVMQALEKILGAVETTALYHRPVKPYAQLVIGPTSFTIPQGVKSFIITNLGLSGAYQTFSPIGVTGISGITQIPARMSQLRFTTEEDQNLIDIGIVVTPDTTHHVFVQYMM